MLARLRSSLRERGPLGTLRTILLVLRLRAARLVRGMKDVAYRTAGLDQQTIDSAVTDGTFAEGVVLTAKFDAFGGRIGDIINGMRVAEALGAQFRFYWPDRDLPGIRPAADVFDEAFLRDHLIHDPELAKHLAAQCWQLEHLAHLRRGGTVWYQSKHDCGEGKFNPTARGFRFPELASFGEAFGRLPLHHRLADVRAWAASLPQFDAAIHVRRGDIFAGDFRIGEGFADKMIPLPVLELIVGRVAVDGGRVLLVGNDLDPVRRRLRPLADLSTPADFTYPAEPAPDLDDLRDFCMIARARRVVAGQSIFAFVPASIGGATLEEPESLLEEQEIASAILDFVRRSRGVPDHEVALGCEYFRKRLADRLTPELSQELHGIAFAADPGNPTYVLHAVAGSIRDGDTDRARGLLDAAALTEMPETVVRMMRCDLDLDRGVGLGNLWSGFLTASDREVLLDAVALSPWLAFVAAAEHAAAGDFVTAAVALHAAAPIADRHPVAAVAAIVADPPRAIPGGRGGLNITPSAEELYGAEAGRERRWSLRIG